MSKRAFPLRDVYGLLEPGPVVLLSTSHRGRDNVMTLSWHVMMEFEPPKVGCVVSNRNHSFSLLRGSKQCAINIPTAELTDAVVGCGNTSGRDGDKFDAFGLTRVAGTAVDVPLVRECYANLECRVIDTRFVNAYNFFVLEVLRARVDRTVADPRTLHHRGWGAFMQAGPTVRTPSRMR